MTSDQSQHDQPQHDQPQSPEKGEPRRPAPNATYFTLPRGGSDAVAAGEGFKTSGFSHDLPSPLVPRDPPGGRVKSKVMPKVSGIGPAPPCPALPSPYVLRRYDQRAVVFWLVIALGAISVWWARQGGLSGRVIELDRAPPIEVRYQVDINTADWPELVQLPGVGETLAMRIIESRRTGGPFRDHKDLRRVRGIGPKTLDALRPHLLPMPDDQAVAEQAAPPTEPDA